MCAVAPLSSMELESERGRDDQAAAGDLAAGLGPLRTAAAARSRRTSLLQAGDPGRHCHRVPATQYVAVGAWTLLLLLEYGLTRAACSALGVPDDCTDDADIVKVMGDFQHLLSNGVVLAVFVGMHWPDRFQYVFAFRRSNRNGLLFATVTVLIIPGWGWLSSLPALQKFSIVNFDLKCSVPLVLLLVGIPALILWHLLMAYWHNSRAGFLAYLLSRMGVVSLYFAYFVIKAQHGDLVFHLHHYVIGFFLATFAEFNHPLSTVLLAAGTGIYVQGIAAYNADPIIDHAHVRLRYKRPGHRAVISPFMSEEAADFFQHHCSFI